MSTAAVTRLVLEKLVPKALAILNGGNALAAPFGAFLGALVGWRGTFFYIVALAAIAFFWQLFTLPRMLASGIGAESNRQNVDIVCFRDLSGRLLFALLAICHSGSVRNGSTRLVNVR